MQNTNHNILIQMKCCGNVLTGQLCNLNSILLESDLSPNHYPCLHIRFILILYYTMHTFYAVDV